MAQLDLRSRHLDSLKAIVFNEYDQVSLSALFKVEFFFSFAPMK